MGPTRSVLVSTKEPGGAMRAKASIEMLQISHNRNILGNNNSNNTIYPPVLFSLTRGEIYTLLYCSLGVILVQYYPFDSIGIAFSEEVILELSKWL